MLILSNRNLSESFPKNFLESVAFEVRFTPLLAIQESIPEFQKRIRKRYPLMGKGYAIQLPFPGSSFQAETSEWVFSSKDGVKQIKAAFDKFIFIAKEYDNHKAFRNDSLEIISILADLTEIDSYSRVGMRYINQIPIAGQCDPLEEVLRLFNPTIDKTRISSDKPFKFSSEFRIRSEESIIICSRNSYQETVERGWLYVIDVDSFTEDDVKHSSLPKIEQNLHDFALKEFHNRIKDEFVALLRGEEE